MIHVRRVRSAVLVLAIGALSAAGCTEVEESESEGYEPAQLQEIKGTDAQRVTFTREGAARVGLRTAAVRRSGGDLVVPYAALIYDGEGKAYVYASPRPLSFVRMKVGVDRVDGGRALLSSGPPAGTRIVTVGAAEVYGAEKEIAGGH